MYMIESGFAITPKNFVDENQFYSSVVNPRWKSHYEKLINRAKDREIDGYVEKHHIVPKCLGGSNDKENLVKLTAEEHYTAHLILVKLFPKNNKLIYAANMMCVGKDSDCKRPNNKQYKWLKLKLNKVHRSYRATEETKRKIGIASTGRFFSEEARKKLSDAGKGRKHSNETLNKMSIGRSGIPSRIWSEEEKQTHGKLLKGKKRSEETKAKMKESFKGRVHSEETKRKISESLKGKSLSEETKRKLSESLKGRVFSEEHLAKIKAGLQGKSLGRKASAETRAKMSASRMGNKNAIRNKQVLS